MADSPQAVNQGQVDTPGPSPDPHAFEKPNPWANHIWRSSTVHNLIQNSTKIIWLVCNKDRSFQEYAHKDVLCHFSNPYRALLAADTAEATSGRIHVDLDPLSMSLFSEWLHTGTIRTNDPNHGGYLRRVYVFGERQQMLALCRDVMTKLQMLHDWETIPYESIEAIWHNTTAWSPLRRYLVDSYVSHYDLVFSPVESLAKGVPPDFIIRVGVGVLQSRGNGVSPCDCCMALCKYHEHESEEEHAATCGSLRPSRTELAG